MSLHFQTVGVKMQSEKSEGKITVEVQNRGKKNNFPKHLYTQKLTSQNKKMLKGKKLYKRPGTKPQQKFEKKIEKKTVTS